MFPIQIRWKISTKNLKMEASPKPVPPRTNPTVNEVESASAAIVHAVRRLAKKRWNFEFAVPEWGLLPGSKSDLRFPQKFVGVQKVKKGRSFVPHADTNHRKRCNGICVNGIWVHRRQSAIGSLKRRFLRTVLNRGCSPHNVTKTILKTKNALREAMVASVGFESMYDRMVLQAYSWSLVSYRK